MYSRRSRARLLPYHRQGGAALVVALLVFALSASLVVAMRAEFTRYFARSTNLLESEQAHAYLRGAEELAVLVLLADYDIDTQNQQVRDDLTEQWAGPAQPFLLDEGGWLRGQLEDLDRRFNLNTLAPAAPDQQTGKRERTPNQEQFIRLLQALGEDSVSEGEAVQITESIGDWIDEDQFPLPDGAEDDFYLGREPEHRAPNRAMTSTSELLSIANVTPQLYRALLPYVRVWPAVVSTADSTINLHTAPAAILRTIAEKDDLQPLSEADGQALVEYREEQGFVDKADFFKHPALGGGQKQLTDVQPLFAEESSYFLLTADVEVAERNLRLYSVLHRNGRKIENLVRSTGAL